MRIFVSILILLSLSPANAFATSVVAVRSNDEIVIGADSKTTLISAGGGAAGRGSIDKCKIVQAGNLFFASAGSAGMSAADLSADAGPEFDLKGIIAEGLHVDGGIEKRVRNLEKALVANLTRIAEEARRENTAFFMERFVKNPVHTVIIGGLENGEPVLMVRTFRLITLPSGSLSFEIGRFSCPGDCRESFVTIMEGRTDAIRQYLQRHKLFLHFADSVTAVRDLVDLEISKEPSSVGPPIDILRLTKEGAVWIQRKPLCPDIQTPMIPRMEDER